MSEKQNYCDERGANTLAERIKAYWRDRGFKEPVITIKSAGYDAGMRATRYDVRSDMRNGYPAR